MRDSCAVSVEMGGTPPIPRERLEALRHPRLLPRSIPPSFTLQSQLLGAEFCASISAAMIRMAQKNTTTNTNTTNSTTISSSPKVMETSSSQALLFDLSAHYGSHTLRRAASYPLGPCYASRERRRALKGHHDGRRQLWSLRAAHKLWCRRCGVFLLSGETKQLLSTCLSTVTVYPENDTNTVSSNTTSTNPKKRGDYVCFRCFRDEYTSRRKNESVDTTLLSLSSEKECPTTTMVSPAKIGRTCRRKRKGRGKSIVPVKAVESLAASIVKTGNEAINMRTATVSAVPKGSLSRRKRERETTGPKEIVPVEKKKEVLPVDDDDNNNNDTQRSSSKSIEGGKIIRVEKTTANSISSSSSLSSSTTKKTVLTKPEPLMNSKVPTVVQNSLPPPPPPKGRRPAAKKNDKSGSTPSSNSFANTMSRLGL
ncbi:uncharacterized protein TM35_000083470 [Trypanosoma theileri]|uniref:Uncharacterized protein n=1 Tax=Trypanosoma theileri TaxID=67003 RepID=A0A1X0P1Z4_9TRYP|nr:uncharacterized protein TM35_000083470 [Trypanosoma theileri]ORC90549.1 hypothetical protein TM35_000083470 [Trypanosoma theileri]